jgi:hypothetical protein
MTRGAPKPPAARGLQAIDGGEAPKHAGREGAERVESLPLEQRPAEWFLDDSTDADPPYDLYGPPTPAEVAAAQGAPTPSDKRGPRLRVAERADGSQSGRAATDRRLPPNR